MAKIKIVAVNKRQVTLDVTWDNGMVRNGMVAHDVPVESFTESHAYLTKFVENAYATVVAEAQAIAYANPVADPLVIAAIGHTFDDLGNIIS